MSITSKNRRVKPFSYLLAGLMAFGAATSAYAGWGWKGSGANANWATAENWNKSASTPRTGAFFRSTVQSYTKKTVNFSAAETFKYYVHVDAGTTEASPILWTVSKSSYGLNNDKNPLWIGSETANGYLKIQGGTHKLGGEIRIGGNYVGGLTFDGVNSFTATGNLNLRKSGSFLRSSNSTVSANILNVAVSDGDSNTAVFNGGTLTLAGASAIGYGGNSTGWLYATNLTLNASGVELHIGGHGSSNTGAKGYIVKNGGNWTTGGLVFGRASGSTASFKHEGGQLDASGLISVGSVAGTSTATFEISGGTVRNTGSYMSIGYNAPGVVTVKDGGKYVAQNNMVLGFNGNGTLTIENGGVVEVPGLLLMAYSWNTASTGSGVLNLKTGGTLFATSAYCDDGGSGTAQFKFDGGVFKAKGDSDSFLPAKNASRFTVSVSANGGIVDADGHDVTIGADISDAVGETGVMSFTGGGKVTIAGAVGWTGTTTLNLGTVIGVTDASKSALLANLTVAIPAGVVEDNTLVLTNAAENGMFSAADIADIVLTGDAEGRYSLVLADGGTTVRLSDTFAGEYVWNDGASGADWTAAGKWSKNGNPGDWHDSTHAVFANTGDAAAVDSAVTAASLAFRANATVTGTAALTVPLVAVSNGVAAAISAPTAGALEKTGAGTLALGADRTGAATVLSEGTLAMSGTASLDWSQLTLGTDPAKPVTLRVGADATLANISSRWGIGNVSNIASTVVKEGGEWTVNYLALSSMEGADASFVHGGGVLKFGGNLDMGNSSLATGAYFEIAGGMVTNTSGYVHMGVNAPSTMTVKTGAKYGMSANNYGIIVSGRASGTLNVQGGDVFANGPLNLCLRAGNATVNVTDGGLLTFSKVQYNAGGSSDPKGGTAAITLDNGTIRANAGDAAFIPDESNLTVTIGANGGTIDANGKDITIAKAIAGTGAVTFKGGGSVTLSAVPTYSGSTTVEVGTTLVVPNPIAGTDLDFIVPAGLANGLYEVVCISGDGAFASDVLTAEETSEGFVMSVDRKTIYFAKNAANQWIGGISGSLTDNANWLSGSVPGTGETATIKVSVEATLTVPDGAIFTPGSIVFPAGCAKVTVNGPGAISGVSTISNASSSHHEFNCAVTCANGTPTLPLLDSNYVKFNGGINLSSMPSVSAMRLYGIWNLTGNWSTPPDGTTIKSGATVNVSGNLADGYNINLENGATLHAGTATAAQGANGKNRILYCNNGSFVVDGILKQQMESSGSTVYSMAGFFRYGSGNAVTRVGGLVHSASTQENNMFRLNNADDSNVNTIVLGSGGLSFLNNHRKNSTCYPYFQVDSGKSVKLASSADWSFGANPISGRDLNLELQGSVTVDTSDYDDRTVAHTVHVKGRIGNHGTMTVKGCGTLSFEYNSDVDGGMSVVDTATLSVKVGSKPGNGVVSIASGATLEVAESGTVTLGGGLTLADGAALGFNFTEKSIAPVLNVTGKTVTFGGQSNVVIKVTVAEGKRVKGGSYALTSGGKFANANVAFVDKPNWVKGVSVVDGEIVLDVKRTGTYVIVK